MTESAEASATNEEQTTAQAGASETLGFQTEVKQLLHLMIHSLYSHPDVFLRELISNASDACDKLRFEAIGNPALNEDDPNLKIRLEFDKDAGTVTIIDNGIGMSREEAITNLGTIAKSGTADFLSNLTGDKQKDSQLIGQFGVGFYSAFIVADQVDVYTRRAGADIDAGVHWSSRGEGVFDLETVRLKKRGTRIVLKLKDEHKGFADNWKLRELVRRYSDHIGFPIVMDKPLPPKDDKADDKTIEVPEEETVNKAKALWTLPAKDIKEEEYKEFYKSVSHDFADPLAWSHNRIEGRLEYTSLLYLPEKAPFDLYQREGVRGLKLYVQRVFIMDNAEAFLPLYLRFVRGVVDSSDLSLNVSREILQQDANVESMKKGLTKKVLDMLTGMADKEPEKYAKFWAEFGGVLKEGVAEERANRDQLLKLFRFASTRSEGAEPTRSLQDYVDGMQPEQDKIYYLVADSHKAAASSPHLEVFRKKGIEVLLLSDRVDEWAMSQLFEFDGKSLQDVSKGKLDLGEDSEEVKKQREAQAKTHKKLLKRVKDALGDAVEEVRVTDRLTESPACLVLGEHDLGPQLREILKASGQSLPDSKPSLELNPDHDLVKRLDAEADKERFAELAMVLHDQAQLAAGEQLDDPGAYVKRVNRLLAGG